MRKLAGRMLRRLSERASSPAPAEPPPAPTPSASALDLQALLRLTDDASHPNINPLWRVTKDLEAARLNTKLLGYQLAQSYESRLQAIPVQAPAAMALESRAVTQADIESRWFRYWCERLKERPRYHRKLWEYAFVMQTLHAADVLRTGARVLGAGSAMQPFSSYLARQGAKVTQFVAPGETETGGAVDPLYNAAFVDLPTFGKHFQRRAAEWPRLPDGVDGFDAVFSIGHVCHLGGAQAGAEAVRNLAAALKPGGLGVFLIEYNYADDAQTLDDWPVVLFQSRQIEALVSQLEADGFEIAPIRLGVGFDAIDRFVDLPPFETNRTPAFHDLWKDGWQAAHLKVMIDGFAVTSFGLVVRRPIPGEQKPPRSPARPGRNTVVA